MSKLFIINKRYY